MGDEKSAQPEHKPSENYAAERIRELVRRRPILSISIIAALSLLIGVAIGVSDEGRAGELEDEVAELERALADAEEGVAEANAAADDARREAKRELAAEVREARSEARRKRRRLDRRAAALGAQEQELEENKIPDGVWELGRDYEAGLYRAPGGGACYWELLTEPAGAGVDHIIDNGGGKNQTLRIDSPFFSTDGCGEWVKIE